MSKDNYNGGLDGGVRPDKYVEGAKRVEAYGRARKILDRAWLRIERKLHPRYPALETQVEIRLPFTRKRRYVSNYDTFLTGVHRSIFIAFGKIGLGQYGWHARGALGFDAHDLKGAVQEPYDRWAQRPAWDRPGVTKLPGDQRYSVPNKR